MKLVRAFFLVAGALALAAPAHANLITNGSFELGTFDSAGFDTLGPGSTAITGWVVGGNSIDWVGSHWAAADGARSLDLSGSDAGSISAITALATVPGQTYVLTFDLAGNPDGGPTVKRLLVDIDGLPAVPFFFDTTGATLANMGWVAESVTFVATSSATSLTFASGTPGFYGPALDNVAVNAAAVPEPASLVLLGAGLSAIVASRRRRQ